MILQKETSCYFFVIFFSKWIQYMLKIYLTQNPIGVLPTTVDISSHNFYIGEIFMFRVPSS